MRLAGIRQSTKLGVLAVAGLMLLTSGCGNWVTDEFGGYLGVTVDDSGAPVILVRACTPLTPYIELAEGRDNIPESEENVERGAWEATQPQDGISELTLLRPDRNWKTVSTASNLEPDKLFLVTAGSVDDNYFLSQAQFRPRELATLDGTSVLVPGDEDGGTRTISRQQFSSEGCTDPEYN
ncbi:hypothetical protein LWF01_17880 [Saxibacter everestensis]|uniref:Uncharacterized protein n=1 Tax=Saxibacter everestensis TaxID=2909229 RepID=A0ABY8QSE7_9MICO|nr:hypothetical protein LWF01_17880 [Brevibacteriaceae bacterium ZFBP1038]